MRSDVVTFKTLDGATTYDSVTDWGFKLTHCIEQKPAPKFERIEVPGANGTVDVSTALSGDIPFNDREVELTFFKLCTDHDAAYALAGDVADAIHGKQLMIQTPDALVDGDTWYSGDVEITECRFQDRACEIDVRATCAPFRYSETDGYLWMQSVEGTALTAAPILTLSNSEFDTPGLQFTFGETSDTGRYSVPALGIAYATTDNLFDLNQANLRYMTIKTNGTSWVNSSVIKQDGQTIDFGSCNYLWYERAAITATNATSNISNVRFPFTTDSHLYVFIESDEVTATGSVVVDGTTYSPRIKVQKIGGIATSIGSDGKVTSGSSTSYSYTSITTGSSISTIIDCGTVDVGLGQILIDVVGITTTGLTAQVMLVQDDVTVSSYIEPDITIEQVTLPAYYRATNDTDDVYTSYPPRAILTQNVTGDGNVVAPSFTDWPRDTVYCEFLAINSSGWVMKNSRWNANVTIWPTQSSTIAVGSMPTYPTVESVFAFYGSTVIYNDVEHIVPVGTVQLDTLLPSGSNTIEYVIYGYSDTTLYTAMLKWPIGVL